MLGTRVRAAALSAGMALVLSGVGTPAAGGDVHDLQEGLPLEAEDTQTAEYRKVQAQASARYELSDEGDDELHVEPQLQYGAGENWHVELTYPVIAGSGDRTGSGDVVIGALYRFLEEGREWYRPSVAAKGELALPTGAGADGLDTDVRLIATKSLTDGPSEDRLHFNIGWAHNAAAEGDERENRFVGIVGYSRKLSEKTVLATDLLREQERQEGKDSTILEAGVLHQLNDAVTLSAGVGAGLGDDSPDVRLMFGFQYSF